MNKFDKAFDRCESEYSIMKTYYTFESRILADEQPYLWDAYSRARKRWRESLPENVMAE